MKRRYLLRTLHYVFPKLAYPLPLRGQSRQRAARLLIRAEENGAAHGDPRDAHVDAAEERADALLARDARERVAPARVAVSRRRGLRHEARLDDVERRRGRRGNTARHSARERSFPQHEVAPALAPRAPRRRVVHEKLQRVKGDLARN